MTDNEEFRQTRRHNWLALALGTIVAVFSYFAYAAAFVSEDGTPGVEPGLVAVALTLAPFVFVIIGFVSRNPEASKWVLRAMGLLLVLGLGIGLISPVLGAAAGFGVGAALTLKRPKLTGVVGNRIWAVVLAVAYTFVLLIISPPAGVMTGALLPIILVGMADEFTHWRELRR